MNAWSRRLGPVFLLGLAGCGTQGELNLGFLEATAARTPDSDASAGASDGAEDGGTGPLAPGPGAPDPLSSDAAPEPITDDELCGEPFPIPTRRYDFEGTGTEVVDRQGGESGVILGGASLPGNGALQLDGDDDYVDLPNGILRGQPELTLLLWVNLINGPAYWRVLDFGTNSEGEDSDEFGVGTKYVALTTETGFALNGIALLIGQGGASNEDRATTDVPADNQDAAVAIVLSDLEANAHLHLNGELVATAELTEPISEFNDVNNWLGRSQYSADPFYPGRYRELRVYDRALSACAVAALTELGPDRWQ